MANLRIRGILGADWFNLALGLVCIGTPFFAGEIGRVPVWNSYAVGLLVAGFAAWNMYAAKAGRRTQAISTSALNLLAGVWLFTLPFVFATNMAYHWASVAEGILLAITSGYVAWAAGRLSRILPGRTA